MKRFKLVLTALMLVAVLGLYIGCSMDADTGDSGNGDDSKPPPDDKTGYRGTGKGLVFFMTDGTMYECSDILGQPITTQEADNSKKVCAWGKAVNIAKDHRGGDFEDWRLPTKDQLQVIYDELRVPEHISDNATVWSSTIVNDNAAWGMDFSDNPPNTRMYARTKDDKNFVRAVRPFSAADTLTPPPVASADPNHVYTAGDIGTGGGLVFLFNNGRIVECSPILGGRTWADAKTLAEAHSGGGFTDWLLPTKQELQAVA